MAHTAAAAEELLAAVTAGVDIVLVKRHGRWRSDAVYAYVEDSIERKLSVSLGVMELK